MTSIRQITPQIIKAYMFLTESYDIFPGANLDDSGAGDTHNCFRWRIVNKKGTKPSETNGTSQK